VNAIARQDQLPGMPEPANLLEIISRAASDPNIDVDKMARLMEMYERIQTKTAEAAFNDAMKACQAEMRPVATNAENEQTHSRYATYAKLDKALRPIYTKHDFSISYDTADSPKPDHIRVLAYVARSGYTRTYRLDMPADGKGAKGGDVMTKTHAAGAAMSYGSRYLLKMIFNVAVGEDDTDGNEPEETITEQQAADLEALCTEVGARPDKFRELFCKVKTFDQILAKNYDACVAELRRYGKNNQAKPR
jgi:hypothetical protein